MADTTPQAPAADLRRAAALMRERADAMDAEMKRKPKMWGCGYRDETAAALGGPAGEMAAPWDQASVRAVADWLDEEAADWETYKASDQEFLAGLHGGDLAAALVAARAYLGTGEMR